MKVFPDETRDHIANICWVIEKAREFQKNIYFCFIDYIKAFDCVDHNKLWKIHKEMGIPHHLTCLLETCMQVNKQQLEPDMEQQTGFKLGKEYDKVLYRLLVYLMYIQCCCWSSVINSGPTLCDPMDCSTPGFPVLHRVHHAKCWAG